MSQPWVVTDAVSFTRLLHYLQNKPHPFSVVIADGVKRTKRQNSTLHMWFKDVAEQQADLDANEVKGMCHRRWGLDIKLRDPQFAWVWDQTGAKLPYEKQCKLLASGVLNISSSMDTKELGEYMDAMFRHFTNDGIQLRDPEARKWEQNA